MAQIFLKYKRYQATQTLLETLLLSKGFTQSHFILAISVLLDTYSYSLDTDCYYYNSKLKEIVVSAPSSIYCCKKIYFLQQ